MLFRAVFWIGIVALLMPHQPDLGMGRGTDAGRQPAQLTALLSSFQEKTFEGLAQVKADIDASRKARGAHPL